MDYELLRKHIYDKVDEYLENQNKTDEIADILLKRIADVVCLGLIEYDKLKLT